MTGSLPTATELEKYNRVMPDAAERLLTLAEREQRFRHRITYTGQASAFIITISFLISATFLIQGNHDVAGSVLATVDLVALVTVFITGQRLRVRK
jgi:uncharacterized membrane protein